MGAGIFYEKGDTRLTVTSRMFSRRYVVYTLNRTPEEANGTVHLARSAQMKGRRAFC